MRDPGRCRGAGPGNIPAGWWDLLIWRVGPSLLEGSHLLHPCLSLPLFSLPPYFHILQLNPYSKCELPPPYFGPDSPLWLGSVARAATVYSALRATVYSALRATVPLMLQCIVQCS